ncbi:hypothetical protein FE772_12665 [Lysobacter enzymogenes]|nr:hypothetical protein [Lysobacter enzymogenes]QCW26390.1 hypothetical protein FE772_12665 [Lysobacter enzymogenes]
MTAAGAFDTIGAARPVRALFAAMRIGLGRKRVGAGHQATGGASGDAGQEARNADRIQRCPHAWPASQRQSSLL